MQIKAKGEVMPFLSWRAVQYWPAAAVILIMAGILVCLAMLKSGIAHVTKSLTAR